MFFSPSCSLGSNSARCCCVTKSATRCLDVPLASERWCCLVLLLLLWESGTSWSMVDPSIRLLNPVTDLRVSGRQFHQSSAESSFQVDSLYQSHMQRQTLLTFRYNSVWPYHQFACVCTVGKIERKVMHTEKEHSNCIRKELFPAPLIPRPLLLCLTLSYSPQCWSFTAPPILGGDKLQIIKNYFCKWNLPKYYWLLY